MRRGVTGLDVQSSRFRLRGRHGCRRSGRGDGWGDCMFQCVSMQTIAKANLGGIGYIYTLAGIDPTRTSAARIQKEGPASQQRQQTYPELDV